MDINDPDRTYCTRDEILHHFGISRSTLYRWERDCADLHKAINAEKKTRIFDIELFETILLEWAMKEYYAAYAHDALKKIVNKRRKANAIINHSASE